MRSGLFSLRQPLKIVFQTIRLLQTALQQGGTPFGQIAVSDFKIAGVPRISYIARQEKTDLVLRILWDDTMEIAEVVMVHEDQMVEMLIVPPCHLTGEMGNTGDFMMLERGYSWRIHGISDFFGRGGRGINLEHTGDSRLRNEMRKDALCHGAAADIAVTDKKNTYHNYLQNYRIF